VSRKHLPCYLAQFDFMYTHCRETESTRMRFPLNQVSRRRLMYKLITD
jgi:hypothetical protein